MEILATLSLALGASWCAGINLYATVFVLGALSRWTSFQVPVEMMALENGWVLAVAGLMYTIEFVADKVPAVDSAWDTVHSFIRIPAGAALAAMALGDVPMEVQVIAAMIGGTLAATSHITKATTRLVAHATGTSPVVSPTASLVEDGLVIGTLGFVVANPVVGILFVVLMAGAAFMVLKAFYSVVRGIFRGIAGFFGGGAEPPTMAMG